MRSPAHLCLLLALFVMLSASGAQGWPAEGDDSNEARVARWALAEGAYLHGFELGRQCPTCLRGVIATQDLSPGDVVMKIPLKLAVRFSNANPAMPSEHARELLDRMHNDPSFNATFGTFWASQPAPDQIFSPELYTDEHLDMLQTPELRALTSWQRDTSELIYSGGMPPYPPFNQTVAADRVSLDTFKYVASLLATRLFGMDREGESQLVPHLVPVADFFNHDDDPNVGRDNDESFMELKVIAPIKAGQAMTISYFANVIHRPDMSLNFFGFTIPREVPFLAAVDLPNFDESNAFDDTPLDDDMYEDPSSGYVTPEEYERLAARLAATPTTEEEDQLLLEGDTVTDWRARAIIQYRMLRKRALRLNLAKIAAHLDQQGEEWQEGSADDGSQRGEL